MLATQRPALTFLALARNVNSTLSLRSNKFCGNKLVYTSLSSVVRQHAKYTVTPFGYAFIEYLKGKTGY